MAKSAKIKNFTIDQILKTNGIEIQIDENIDGNEGQFGDIYVTKTGVIWCKGKTHRDNGIRFSFDELDLLADYKNAAVKAAKEAKKANGQ